MSTGWLPAGYMENSVNSRLRVSLEHFSTHQCIRAHRWMPKGCLGKALDGREYKIPLLQYRNDIEGHPATSARHGWVLERTILKMLDAIWGDRLEWTPNWVPFVEIADLDTTDLDTKDWDMEVIERREIGHLTFMYRQLGWNGGAPPEGWGSPQAELAHINEQIALSSKTDFEVFEENEGYREWALSKFIENFMRQWFTSYTGDPHRDGETCKKRVHGKTRFRWAFCEGPSAPSPDVVEMLMGMYEEAEEEEAVEAAKRKKQNKIDRQRSTVLAWRVKNTLIWSGQKKAKLASRITLFEQQLEYLKAKMKQEEDVSDWCDNQRAAFLMPLVSKDLWNIFKESKENAGERVFECPSNTTVCMVRALQDVSQPDTFPMECCF